MTILVETNYITDEVHGDVMIWASYQCATQMLERDKISSKYTSGVLSRRSHQSHEYHVNMLRCC